MLQLDKDSTYAILELAGNRWIGIRVPETGEDRRTIALRTALKVMEDTDFVVYSVGHSHDIAAELVARRNSGRTTQRVRHEGRWMFVDEVQV